MSASTSLNIDQLKAGSRQLDRDSIPDALKRERMNQSDITNRYSSINNNDSFSQEDYNAIIDNSNLVGDFTTTGSDNTVSQYNNILRKIQLLTTRLNSVTTNNKKFMINTKLRLKLILDRIHTTRLNLGSIINNNNTEELRRLQLQNADLTSQLSDLQNSCSVTQNQLQDARQQIDRNNQTIRAIEVEKNRLTAQLKTLQQKYAGLERLYQTLLASRGNNAAEIDRLIQQTLDLEDQMTDMQNKIVNLEADINDKRRENQILANTIADLELDLTNQITTHHDQLLKINQELDSGFSNAITNLNNNNDEIKNIMTVIKEIEDELDVFDHDITTATTGGGGGAGAPSAGASGDGGAGASGTGAGGGAPVATNSSSSSGTSPIIPSSVPSVPSGVSTTGPDGVPTTPPLGVTTTVPSGVITNNSSGGGGPVSNATTSFDIYSVPRPVNDNEVNEMQVEFDLGPSSNRSVQNDNTSSNISNVSNRSNVSSVGGVPVGSLNGPIHSGVVIGNNQLQSPSGSPPGSLTALVSKDKFNTGASPVNPYSGNQSSTSVKSSTNNQSSTSGQVTQEMKANDTGALLPPFTSKTTSTKNLSGSTKFKSVIDKYIHNNQSELNKPENENLKDNLNYLSAHSEEIYNLATQIEPSAIDSISSDFLKTLVGLVKKLIEQIKVLSISTRLNTKDVTFMKEISLDEFKPLIPTLENVLQAQKDRETRNSELIRNIGTKMPSNKGGKMKTRMKRKRRKTQKKKK